MGLRKRTLLNEYLIFFITTTCNNWLEIFLDDKYFEILYKSLIFLNKKYSAQITGYVFMKNHIHLIIYFDKQNNLSAYMRDFKKYTSGEIRRLLEKEGYIILLEKLRYDKNGQKFKVWMDRFDDVVIKNSEVLF
jgi:putative transposase